MLTKVQNYYYKMALIRFFEETVLEGFQTGVFAGTTHTYIGQEANAVGIISNLRNSDIVVSNHRCHGHFLAYGGFPEQLFAELMGLPSGVCNGRGGSQHLHWQNFFSNGIQGGIVPMATGMALAEKINKENSITTVFLGDGTMGEGIVYECLNMASLWKAPILFVIEDNHIAQTTPGSLGIAGSISDRLIAFRIPCMELHTSDVMLIDKTGGDMINFVRDEQRPYCMVIDTVRFAPHSKGDDTRNPQEMDSLRNERDPLQLHAKRLDSTIRQELERQARELIGSAFKNVLNEQARTGK